MTVKIERYRREKADEWNAFVAESKNGTFLFDRRYMDYHSNRFNDFSLIIRNEKGKIIALLPANEKDGTLYSHQGLTYGGILLTCKSTAVEVSEIFEHLCEYMRKEGIGTFIYKAIPHVYHSLPAEEDLYALHNVCDATLISRSIGSCIIMDNRLPLRQNRRTALNKAHFCGTSVKESNDFDTFWGILCDNLKQTYNSAPVHTVEEIKRLKNAFPERIRLYMSYNMEGTATGGIVIYEMKHVVHTQYISANEEGKRDGAVDAIMEYLMNHYSDRQYFDFGTSTIDNGRRINESLIFQKEGFGARGICYDTYEIVLNN